MGTTPTPQRNALPSLPVRDRSFPLCRKTLKELEAELVLEASATTYPAVADGNARQKFLDDHVGRTWALAWLRRLRGAAENGQVRGRRSDDDDD